MKAFIHFFQMKVRLKEIIKIIGCLKKSFGIFLENPPDLEFLLSKIICSNMVLRGK